MSSSSCFAVGSSSGVGPSVALVEHWDGGAWVVQPTPDLGAGVVAGFMGVACASSALCFAAGGMSPAVASSPPDQPLLERWDGSAWAIETFPLPGGTSAASFAAMSCGAPTSCTAVGSYTAGDGIGRLIEHWDGSTWSFQSSPSPSPVHQSEFNGVSCPSATNCTAVGYSVEDSTNTTSEVIERWNGTSWSITSVGHYTPLVAVSCFDTWHCLATGNGIALRGAGSAWSDVSPDPSTSGQSFGGVACDAAVDCYVTRSFSNASILHWDGSTWTSTAVSPSSAELLAVACRDAGSCIVVGAFDSALLVELQRGSGWVPASAAPVIGPVGAVATSIACVSATDCVAVGSSYAHSGQAPYIETWNGNAWTLDHRPLSVPSNVDLRGIACADAQDCVAVGNTIDPVHHTSGGIALILRAGKWTTYLLPSIALNGVACPSVNHCVAAGSNTISAVVTSWNGTRWSQPGHVATNSWFQAIACPDVADCVAVGARGTNNGPAPMVARLAHGTWKIQTLPYASQMSEFTAVACPSTNSCVAVGHEGDFYGTINGLVAQTGGDTWHVSIAPVPDSSYLSDLDGVACNTTERCWAVGIGGDGGPSRAMFEQWDGQNWSFVQGPPPIPSIGMNGLAAIACPTSSRCVAAGSGAGSGPLTMTYG